MPFRIKHSNKYATPRRMYQSMKAAPGYFPPSQLVVPQRDMNPEELDAFDKEYEAFVAEQKKLNSERKKKRKKNANDQSNQQIETDLKLLTANLSD